MNTKGKHRYKGRLLKGSVKNKGGRQRRRRQFCGKLRSPLVFPIALSILIGVFTLFVQEVIENNELDRQKTSTDALASSFSTRLQSHIEIRLGVVEILRQEWQRGQI